MELDSKFKLSLPLARPAFLTRKSSLIRTYPSYSLFVKLKLKYGYLEDYWKYHFFTIRNTNQIEQTFSANVYIHEHFLSILDKIKPYSKVSTSEQAKPKENHMKIDKEVFHPVHPQHRRVKLEYSETPFNCDGCKEVGIGLKYKCQQCDFDLHKACAVAPSNFTHPFYPKCDFKFYYQPPGPERRRCDACQKDVVGFTYHCKRCDFDLHPCCANLPQVLDDGEKNLYLCLKLWYPCHHCGGKGSGWSYRSECKTYNLHVSCVKELLLESWQATYLNVDKNKVRNLQTNIPNLKGGLRRGGNVSKMAGVAIRAIASAVLGDPTAILAAAIGAFVTK